LNCDEARALVHAYVDGELDVARSLDLERHLAGCAQCRAIYQSQLALRDGVRAAAAYTRAPADLRKRIQSTVRQESRRDAPASQLRWAWLVSVVLLVVAVLVWGLFRSQQAGSQTDLVAQEVLASSMRSLIAGPLTDVVSSDQHTVKPWFAGKLDFSPTVHDFGAQGFPLAGGRLDYAAGRSVAALVYRHQQHVINLYVWPSTTGTDAPLQETAYQGYHVFHWAQGGMAYWAVSDMDAAELRQFVELVQQAR
jgi:anti-sigma factor RsiW